jgi:hypothetical protein
MQQHPTHLIQALVAALVIRREQQERASERRRFRLELLVQQAIDRAYAEARAMGPGPTPADS